MKDHILKKYRNRKDSLTLEEYKRLKDGLKKTLVSKSSLYNISKGCFVLSLPLLAVNTGQAQCQTFSITNSLIPNTTNFANGLGVDVDGDMVNDFFFYENPGGDGKVRRAAAGTMSIVTTGNMAYTFRSAINFDSNDPIPGGNGADYRAFWDYPGGGNWPVENSGPSATGFMGIKKGSDYGFLEFTVLRDGSGDYIGTFPSGGAPESTSGDAEAGDCSSLLPVDFLSFITQTRGNDVTLIWKTSSETDNAGFQLQRSNDGREFEDIHWVDGLGASALVNSYEYTDEDLKAGIYYYRLNQIDFNGQSDLSPIVSVEIKGEASEAGEFYPNPAESGEVSIDISSFEASEWIADIYDSKGVLMNNQTHQLREGNNKVTLNTEALSVGAYFVKFENGKERF